MADLKVSCPSCAALLKLANASLAGEKVRCPKCQSVIPVPADLGAATIQENVTKPAPDPLASTDAAEESEESGIPKFALALSTGFLLFVVVGGIGGYIGLNWYNEQHAVRPLNIEPPLLRTKPPDDPTEGGPPSKVVEQQHGFPTPDAVLDAYVKALRDGDLAACKATMTRERLKHDESYLSEQLEKPVDREALDKKFLGMMNYYKGSEWKEGEYKRFPVELKDEDQAIIVCVYQNKGKGLKDRYRRYVLVKGSGGWLQADWKDGDAKELEATQYPYTWMKK